MDLNGEAMEVKMQLRRRQNSAGECTRFGGRRKVKVKTHDCVKMGSTTSVLSF